MLTDIRRQYHDRKTAVVAQFERMFCRRPDLGPNSCEIRGDAYIHVGGRKRQEHVFEGAAPTTT